MRFADTFVSRTRLRFRAITSRVRFAPLSTSSRTSPREQLSRIRELIQRVGSTNKPQEKRSILAEYQDLRELLEQIYDPHVKHHVTSTKVIKALSSDPQTTGFSPASTIESLLEDLSTRRVTGNQAVQEICLFMRENGIDTPEQDAQRDGLSLKEVFFRLLDKNLKAGIAEKTLKAVCWNEGTGEEEPKSEGLEGNPASSGPLDLPKTADQQALESPDVLPPPTRFPGFSCALGKTVLRKDLARVLSLPDSQTESSEPPGWLASRKLDGVRLLVVIDVLTPHPKEEPNRKEVIDIWTVSRTGKEYHTLDVLKQGISEAFKDWSQLGSILENEPRHPAPHSQGYIQRLVLDGELCHLINGNDQDLSEDFTQIVSMVRRKNYTIELPVLFLLDVLPWSVFVDGMGKGGGCERYKVFAKRVEDCAAIVSRILDFGGEFPVVRRLEQIPVNTIKEVEDMIGVAAERGWEGIVLRRGDLPYIGKRSSSILKYKEWQDGEYVVEDIDINIMRLPSLGIYAEREALASVWIKHKGTRVSVGSGFTAEERLRYAADPSLIIGKEITVEYFAESTATTRGGAEGGVSLRFPRVKRVWEEGKRDV